MREEEAKRIGALMRQLREERQWTQTELAKSLGVTRAAINNYEQGRCLPGETNRQLLAHLFDVSEEMFQATLLRVRSQNLSHADMRSNPLAKRLTELRLASGLSQRKVNRNIGLYETGKLIPGARLLRELAQFYHVDEQELFSLREQARERAERQKWPYVIADGIHAGKKARIVDPPAKAYKPLKNYHYPDPVWIETEDERLSGQWFPRPRLQRVADQQEENQ